MTVSLKAMKKWQIVCSIPKPAEVQGTLLKGVFKICDEARYSKLFQTAHKNIEN